MGRADSLHPVRCLIPNLQKEFCRNVLDLLVQGNNGILVVHMLLPNICTKVSTVNVTMKVEGWSCCWCGSGWYRGGGSSGHDKITLLQSLLELCSLKQEHSLLIDPIVIHQELKCVVPGHTTGTNCKSNTVKVVNPIWVLLSTPTHLGFYRRV
jgi:hypothetical protein